ncbi:C40 family peptidase [Bacillus sp. FJAT-29937]|uniref:C40 family peptidase n=1 Tax=Bacillus sp. FJAT-29937 TaxID=1720553 RepID=UPI00082E6216|nr:C40 family peptidase [Bacillus sp. FJAT-29937]
MRKQLLTMTAAAGLVLTAFQNPASAHELTYQVRPGDMLWKIALANNLSISQLMEWNSLLDDVIYPGQSLSLLAPHTHEEVTYIVKNGDTLWKIATANNLSVSQLMSMNNLSSNVIYAGQKLTVQQAPASQNKGSAVSKVETMIAEAKKYIGVPYVWGGSSPAGFDCSGYLNYVFNHAGIPIPRTVLNIWNATKPVSSPNIGDIVFFNTSSAGPSHAGIYLGNNKFIHSGSSTGVTISDMTLTYWKSRYLGAKTAF